LNIALAVETAGGAGRDILRGIARYAKERGQWRLLHQSGTLDESLSLVFREARTGEVDGVIVRVTDARVARNAARLQVPVVDVLGAAESRLPLVHVDDVAIGRLGAKHFLERGYRSFACCGPRQTRGLLWSGERAKAFEGALGKAFVLPRFEWRLSDEPRKVESELRRLARWIGDLPKPVGIFATVDALGRRVLDACRRAGLEVPGSVAVLGVDNDEILCELAHPALSSIDANHFGVGFEAAALLDRMLKGEEARRSRKLLEPVGMVVRSSTQRWGVHDPGLAAALSVIHERACKGASVDDVVAKVGLSRRTLERRFRDYVGRSIYEEILRVRIARVEELLGGTDLPIKSIASEAGFSHPEHLSALYRARGGRSPTEYRNQVRRATRQPAKVP
jgi:LacI family transcriptional regulator